MSQHTQCYLASASPRRKELLTQIGVRFQCLPVMISEEMHPGEAPADYAARLAVEKAQYGWQSAERKEELPVLGADTIVVINNEILGKPKDAEDSVRMLRLLSGRMHEVMTAVALVQDQRIEQVTSLSRVYFREITAAEAEKYWYTQEPADKAGGYAIQGKAAIFVKSIEGSPSGIMGLPLFETMQLFGKFGIHVF